MDDNNIIKIEAEVNLTKVLKAIEESGRLEDNSEIFAALAQVEAAKKQVAEAQDALKRVESDVKAAINGRAKALLGDSWNAIKGNGYKIIKKAYGSLYEMNGKPQKKFLIVKTSVDSKAVDVYVKEKGKLPAGIDYNVQRGESIVISVDLPAEASHDNS